MHIWARSPSLTVISTLVHLQMEIHGLIRGLSPSLLLPIVQLRFLKDTTQIPFTGRHVSSDSHSPLLSDWAGSVAARPTFPSSLFGSLNAKGCPGCHLLSSSADPLPPHRFPEEPRSSGGPCRQKKPTLKILRAKALKSNSCESECLLGHSIVCGLGHVASFLGASVALSVKWGLGLVGGF